MSNYFNICNQSIGKTFYTYYQNIKTLDLKHTYIVIKRNSNIVYKEDVISIGMSFFLISIILLLPAALRSPFPAKTPLEKKVFSIIQGLSYIGLTYAALGFSSLGLAMMFPNKD